MQKLFIHFVLLITINVHAQSLSAGKKMVDTLTSAAFWGRGYTNDGMKKAGKFLATEFQSYGLIPMNGNDFLQEFS